jgi:hypothetical protein
LARVGLLLILDDLQWADPTSVALLALLARRTNGHRVALVATILVEDRQHAFDSTLLAVRRLPDAQEIPLPPSTGRRPNSSLLSCCLCLLLCALARPTAFKRADDTYIWIPIDGQEDWIKKSSEGA